MSTRINKTIAEEVSSKMLNKLFIKKLTAKENVENFIGNLLIDRLPKEILACFRDNNLKKFVRTSSSFRVYYHSDYYWISFKNRYPSTDEEKLILTHDEGIKFHKLREEEEDLKTKYKYLFEETVGLLMKLQTYNKIKQEFPEAAEHLPERLNTSLMINIEDTRKKINEILQ
jgi:hypothetical protein